MLRVFAVEDTTAQIVWDSPPGDGVVRAGDAAGEVTGGPGAVVLEGLPPDTALDLVLEPEGGPARRVGRFRTLATPPDTELARLATVNDCHLGGRGFGLLPAARHPDGPFPPDTHERCLRAAVAESVAWGAGLLVAKGDLTEAGRVRQWRAAATILGGAGVPAVAVPGNHDVTHRSTDGRPILAAAGVRLTVDGVDTYDLPGLRVIVADSSNPLDNHGSVKDLRASIVALAAAAPGGALVALHHQFERFGLRTHWPPGVPRPEGDRFLDDLAAANPATLVTTGHTHRHRRRRHGPLVVTEVGSNKDFPGTWAGYAVHEGGIRQVVRRVADPAVLRWTDATRHCFLGLWGTYSSGTRDGRCFSHPWPEPDPLRSRRSDAG